MNELARLKRLLNEQTTELRGLLAKAGDDRTEADRARISELTEKIQETNALKTSEETSVALSSVGQEVETQGMRFTPAGSAVIEVTQDGEHARASQEDREGPGTISERQWHAISEPSYKRDWLMASLNGFKDMGRTEQHALQEGLDTGGGYLVPADMLREIIMRDAHPTEILGAVRRLTTGSDVLKIPQHTYSTDDKYRTGVRVQWTGELGTTTEDTSLQAWGMREIPIHEGTFDIQLSRSMKEDAPFDLENFIVEEARSIYELEMDRYIVSTDGNGVKKPRGILLNPGGTNEPPTTNVGNPVGGDGIIDLFAALPAQYRKGASWLSDTGTVWADIAQIKAGSNEYIGFVKSWDGNPLAAERVDSILGRPVIYSCFMPGAGAANKILVWADFKKLYGFVERIGLAAYPYGDQDRAMLVAGLVGVMFRCRVGGAILQPRAGRVGVQS